MVSLGEQGGAALKRVERELLLKVVTDFANQLIASDLAAAHVWHQRNNEERARQGLPPKPFEPSTLLAAPRLNEERRQVRHPITLKPRLLYNW